MLGGMALESRVDAASAAYLHAVVRRLRAALGDRLIGAWVVGSAALGDFDARRSDLDVQAIADGRPARRELEALAAELSHPALPCPARGLELVLYPREGLEDPRGPAFALNLNTGPRMDQHVALDPDGDPRFWFVIDVSIARQHAIALHGPSAAAAFPEPRRSLVVASPRGPGLVRRARRVRGPDDPGRLSHLGLGDGRALALQAPERALGARAPARSGGGGPRAARA